MNYKTVSKPISRGIEVPKTNDYKVKISTLIAKISNLFSKINEKEKINKYRYVNKDRNLEVISIINFYSNRYHSNL